MWPVHDTAVGAHPACPGHLRDVPLHTVIGGFHSGETEKIIPETVEALRQFGLTTIAAGHCTGWRVMAALVAAFGDKVVTPTAVGKRFVY